jgi:AcrR family transcriptional regulator
MAIAVEQSEARKTRSARRTSRTRKRLLDAALRKFADKGSDATTIEEITEAADLGKGTFYRHFSCREELMVALVDDVVTLLLTALSDHKPAPRNLPEALDRLLLVHWDFSQTSRDAFVLLFQGRLLLKLQREAIEDLEQPYRRYLTEIENFLTPFVLQLDRKKVQRLTYAIAGFVSGFLSFAMIDLAAEEIKKSLGPMRQAFVAASEAFLANQGTPPSIQPGTTTGPAGAEPKK